MKPLTPLKYYAANKKKASLVIVILILAACIVSFTTSLIMSIIIDATKANLDPFKNISIVRPGVGDVYLKDSAVEKIDGFEDVDRTYGMWLEFSYMKTIVGQTSAPIIFPDDMTELNSMLKACKLKLKEGRLPEGGEEYEILLHERILMNKGLKVGDYMGQDVKEDLNELLGKYKIVGTVEGDAFISFANHSKNKESLLDAGVEFVNPAGLLLVPKEGRLTQMNESLEDFSNKEAQFFSLASMQRLIDEQIGAFQAVMLILVIVTVFIISVSVSALIYIIYNNRNEEFGILCAMGYRKAFISRLVFKELACLAFVSWAIGYFCSAGLFGLVNTLLLNPSGQHLYFFTPIGLINTLIIPVMVIICATVPMLRKLKKWDPIAVIERRE